jgi:hypothetical protein
VELKPPQEQILMISADSSMPPYAAKSTTKETLDLEVAEEMVEEKEEEAL